MSEGTQIIFMQARLIRLAAYEWSRSLNDVIRIFAENGILDFIRECFGVFHVEGDYAVLEEIEKSLAHKGVDVNAGTT